MAVIEKIRTKFGVAASIIIAVGLLLFIIDPSEIMSAVQNMSSKYDVGKIGSKSISYQDFQNDVEKYTRIHELVSGNTVSGEQEQMQVRNAAWQALVEKYLFSKNAKAAGLAVGEAENLALLTSEEYVSPLIANDPSFADETGSFSPEAVKNIARQAKENPDLKLYWDYVQNSVYFQQLNAKYNALFTASNFQNPLQLRKAIEENNNTSDVDFVMVPMSFAPDSTLTVSAGEIKEFYASHKKFFKQPASRDIEYVVFEVKPSATDVKAASDKMVEAYEEFVSTDNMKSFLSRNSEQAWSNRWYKAGEMNPVNRQIGASVDGAAKDAVSEIVTDNNVFYAARIMDTAMLPDSAYVKHILLQGESVAKADSLLEVVKKGENFANLATTYSADKGSAADGEQGNIGWLTQNYMIPGFEDVITAEVNKPYILNTQYGTHIVVVTRKTAPVAKKQVAVLKRTALASKETFNDYYAQASRFADIARGKSGKGKRNTRYQAAVDSTGVYSHVMNNVLESTSSYGGVDNAKQITRWVFDAKKPGYVSEIITIDNNYFFVATLKGIHEEGYADVKEVASQIREQLLAEKRSEKEAADVAAKIEGMTDLAAIAEKLGTSVNSRDGVTFSSLTSQSLDPKFLGAVANAPVGQICGPVAGNIGTYVFQVKSHDTGAFFTEDDARNRARQMAGYSAQMILPVMMEAADVKDNRARFY